MSFQLSEEHEAFRQIVRDFAEKEIAPHVGAWDKAHHFPLRPCAQRVTAVLSTTVCALRSARGACSSWPVPLTRAQQLDAILRPVVCRSR